MLDKNSLFYGFDMGGTKIELAVYDRQLNCLWKKRVATPTESYASLLKTFNQLALEADNHFGQKGVVGVGLPGIINQKTGIVFTTNVPCAKHKNLLGDLKKCLDRQVSIENDANCFALSEAWDYKQEDYPTVLGIILGTGVGAGYVDNHRIISGMNGVTGEIGHLPFCSRVSSVEYPKLLCGCHKYGCVEKYLSGKGFEWLYEFHYAEALFAKEIIQRYDAGERQAQEHVDRYLEFLAEYLGSIFTLYDPHVVILGGGLSNFQTLYSELPSRVKKYLFDVVHVPIIAPARYGDAGGTRGAALLNVK